MTRANRQEACQRAIAALTSQRAMFQHNKDKCAELDAIIADLRLLAL